MDCPDCDTKITFWMMLKQPTPYYFKCSNCKVRFKVSTPGMHWIFIAVILGSLILFAGLVAGTEMLGAVFAIPFFLLMVGIYFLLEIWTSKYIEKKGTFIRILKIADEG